MLRIGAHQGQEKNRASCKKESVEVLVLSVSFMLNLTAAI